MSRLRMVRCIYALAAIGIVGASAGPAWATLPTPNQPILLVQSSASTDPYQNFLPELLLTEGLNGFQIAQLSDLTAAFLANYDVVILPHLSLISSQATLFQNYVSAGGTLIGFRPDSQLANIFGVSPLGSTLSDSWLQIDTSSVYGSALGSQVMKFHGTADLYALNGATALATLYSSSTSATSSPAAAIYSSGSGQAILFSFDLTQSIVLMRQGNPAWAGYPDSHDGQNIMRASQMFMDINTNKYWNDLGDGALNDVPQADIEMRLFSNALVLSNAAKRPLPRFWYYPNQERSLLLFTGDHHGDPVSNSTAEINAIVSYGGKFSEFLWYPFGTISSSQVNTWLSAGHAFGVHFDDTAETDAQGNQGADVTWNGMSNVITKALSSFATTFPQAPKPVTTRNHWVLWLSQNAAGQPDQVAQAKLFQTAGIQFDVTYDAFPYRWGYMTGSGLPMKFLDTATGTVIPVFEQATEYEDDVQLYGATSTYSMDWDVPTATSHYQQSLSDSLTKYNTVVTMLFHPDEWNPGNAVTNGDSSGYAQAVLQYAQANSIPMVTTASWNSFWQTRAATALSMPSFTSNTLAFAATGSPAGLTLLVPAASGTNKVASTFTVDGVTQSFTVAQYQGVPYASVILTAGTHNISVAYTAAGRISGQISPNSAASSTTVQAKSGSITETVPVAADGTYAVGPLPAGTYTVTPTSSLNTFSPVSLSPTLGITDVTNVNFAVAASAFAPIRINAAGPSYTDSQGNAWSADTDFSGGTASAETNAVANTTDPALYQTERWGPSTYTFTVPAGNYSVTLKFAELWWTSTGQRLFNVAINGTTVLTNFDIVAAAGGPNTAIDQTFAVTAGAGSSNLQIQFIHVSGQPDDPKIDAIQIVSGAPTQPAITTQPANQTVTQGQTATFNVVASGMAPLSYQWQRGGVNLTGATTASYTTAATVAGDNGATFDVVVSNGLGGITSNTATLTVNPPVLVTLSSVSVNPTSVTGGASSNGTVALSGPAPAGGILVALSSSNTGVATVPANVTVAANASSAVFTVTTQSVATASSITITASYSGATANATLAVNPPAAVTLSSVSVNPTSVTGGASSNGTVTLSGPAPAGGILVALSSSNTGVATVPANVTVAANASTAGFTVTTQGVAGLTNITITASYNGSTTGTLTVNPPVSFTPIRINAAGPSYTDSQGNAWSADTDFSGGTASAETNAVANTTDPALYQTERWGPSTYTFTVPAGNYSVTLKFAELWWTSTGQRLFNVAINGTTVLTNFDIVAAAGGPNTAIDQTFAVTAGAGSSNLQIQFIHVSGQPDDPKIDAIQIVSGAPTQPAITTQPANQTVTQGQTATFNVVASGMAPLSYQWQRGGVNLTGATTASYTTAATVAGDNGATFDVLVSNAGGGATSNTATLTVNPPATATLSSVSLSPTSVTGGAGSTGTVKISAAAPAGGVAVTLSSNNTQVATVPASVTVAQGATTATFPIATTPVASNTTVSLSASLNGTTKSANLTVNRPALSSLSVSPTSVKGGSTSTGTVTLSGAAPAGGTTITLSDNQTYASEPASVTVPAGATSVTFTITTTTVTSTGTATISGSLNGTTKSASLKVTT